jgi:NADH-quinone oxidoreductase subunit M
VGVILAAVYLLWAYQRAFTGVLNGENAKVRDLKVRELTAVVPLLGLSFFLGVYPKPVLDRVEPSVRRVVCSVERGSDYREPAVVKLGAPSANCRELDTRELAGR